MPTSSVPRLDDALDVPRDELPAGLPADPADTFAPEFRAAPALDDAAGASEPLGRRPLAYSGISATSADVLSRWSLFGEAGLSIGPDGVDDADAATDRDDSSAPRGRFAPGESTTRPGAPAGTPGAPLGGPQYRLDRLVGEGGMGEVWEAWQESLGRVVAVKRIRPRLLARPDLSDSDRARAAWDFRQEAAITAHLEHPNIVPVHDLGADARGNPLLAMKLVKGRSWEKIARDDFAALPEEEFLAKHLPILADVAQAVAFAHSRGVAHRDLKPGQVMVGEFGETLLMDWGLAVVFDARGEEERGEPSRPSILSTFGFPSLESASNPAGTPALMAPEQTTRTARDIGPWTDVYLLGGTLYYLLTGGYPHKAKTSGEALRRARAGVVEAPSRRAPGREIPAQLEALCAKALAKEPSDRVDSAKDFVAALEDYLTGATRRRECAELAERVEARLSAGQSLGYGDLTECLGQLARARSLWPSSPKLPSLADRALELHARAALASGDLALARAQAARVESSSIRDGLLADVARGEARARALARQRRALLAGFVSLLLVVAAGLAIFVWVVERKNNDLDQANSDLSLANRRLDQRNSQLEFQRQYAEASGAIALERAAESQQLLEFLLTGLKSELDLTLPRDRRLRDAAVAQVLRSLDDHDAARDTPESLALHADGLARVSLALRDLAMLDEAEELAARAVLRALEAEGRGAPRQASPLMALGGVLARRAKFDEAEKPLREALAIAEGQPGGATSRSAVEASFLLGEVLRDSGRTSEAREALRGALEAAEARAATTTPKPADLVLADALNNLATLARAERDVDEAESLLRRALAEAESVRGADHPDIAPYVGNLALLLSRDRRSFDEAEPLMLRALAIAEAAWGADHPNVARCLANLGGLRIEQGRVAEAEEAARRALAICEGAYGEEHPQTALAVNNLARVVRVAGRLDEAETLYARAVAWHESAGGRPHPNYALALSNHCELLAAAGRVDEAVAQGRKAVAIGERALPPDHPMLAGCRSNLALALEKAGKRADALALLRLAREPLARQFGPSHPSTRSIDAALARLETPEPEADGGRAAQAAP